MEHGGDIYTEGILKGIELIDFSSNINPLGVPDSYKKNIQEALKALNRYPDAQYRNLKSNLKGYININNDIVDKEDFILGNGASEIIDLVISCFDNIMITVPSFGEYEQDAQKWNDNIIFVPPLKNLEYNYDFILNNLYKTDALIIGNPNNPDGKIINKAKFKPILDFCEKNNKKIIIDEAFIEFTADYNYSFVEELKNYKCLLIIRALTKFYAMPGIRFGFGICKDEMFIDKIKKKQNPWNVNCFAEVAAKYVLKDTKYIEKSIQWIKQERTFLVNELKNIDFIENVYNTHSNFVLCKLKKIDCYRLYYLCIKENICIRKCDNFRGLDKQYARFAIKDRDKNMKLLSVLKYI